MRICVLQCMSTYLYLYCNIFLIPIQYGSVTLISTLLYKALRISRNSSLIYSYVSDKLSTKNYTRLHNKYTSLYTEHKFVYSSCIDRLLIEGRIVSPGIDPGYSRLSQTKNNMYEYNLVYCCVWKCCKFLAVHRVGVMTLLKCRVDHPFPYHVIRCWVRTRPLPPQYGLWVASLNPLFKV
jgi:hypothetical protein